MQIVFIPSFPYATGPIERDAADGNLADTAVERFEEAAKVRLSRTANFEAWHESAAQLMAAAASGVPTFATDAKGRSTVLAFNTDDKQPNTRAPTILIGRIDQKRANVANPKVAYGLNVVWPIATNFWTRPYRDPTATRNGRHASHAGTASRRPDEETGTTAEQAPDAANGNGTTAGERHPAPRRTTPEAHHRYRFFMLDGRLVTGAGVIAGRCPMHNGNARFDPVTERVQGDGDPHETPAAVARMEAFARGIAANLKRAKPDLVTAAIDTAIGVDDATMLIGLNPTCNARLYASNFPKFLRAITAWLRHEEDRTTAPSASLDGFGQGPTCDVGPSRIGDQAKNGKAHQMRRG